MSAEAPENVAAVSVGVTALDVTWARPGTWKDGMGAELISYGYGVFIRKQGDKDFTLVFQTRDDEYSFRCEDLLPKTTYEVYVQSFGVRPGECSSTIEVDTAAGAPEFAPENLVILEDDADIDGVVIAQWEPPAGGELSGPVAGYRVFYDKEDEEDTDFHEVELPATECTCRLSNISSGCVYRFQVIAFNDGGEGPESPILRWLGDKIVPADGEAGVTDGTSAAAVSISGRGSPSLQRKAIGVVGRDTVNGGGVDALPGSPLVPASHIVGTADVPESTSPKRPFTTRAAAHAMKVEQALARRKAALARSGMTVVADTETEAFAAAVSEMTVSDPASSQPTTSATSPLAKSAYVKFEPEVPMTALSQGVGLTPQKRLHQNNKSIKAGNRTSCIVMSRSRTIRGKRNGVRNQQEKLAKIKTEATKVMTPMQRAIEDEKKKHKLVVYTTTISTVRATFLECNKLKQLLHNLRYRVYVRDVSMDKTYANELQERKPGANVPQIFAAGEYFGDYEHVFTLNERQQLEAALRGFDERPMDDCPECVGTGFIVCDWCDGTGKSTKISSSFEQGTNKTFLKCTACNENGLQRCRSC